MYMPDFFVVLFNVCIDKKLLVFVHLLLKMSDDFTVKSFLLILRIYLSLHTTMK